MTRLTAALLCCSALCLAQYKGARRQPPAFEGPGREQPEPPDVREVAIGYYGPAGEDLVWQGAVLALETANREGGYKRIPFRLVPRWSEDPWRGGAALVARMVYEDRVWAIVGSADGAATHLAEQVVVKSLLSLVNPAATDRSIHMAGVPWMFSLVQGDDSHAAMLAGALRGNSVAILSATDHDSRAFTAQFKSTCARRKISVRRQIDFDPARPDLVGTARLAMEDSPDVVVVAASARHSARAVKALRAAGYGGLLAGGPWFGRAAFVQEAGGAAEGALFPWVGAPAPDFQERFAERFRRAPDYAAACAYDSVAMVVAAVRKAGLNRARIRDEIAALSAYQGASGRIDWDQYGQNRRAPVLAVVGRGGVIAAADPLAVRGRTGRM